MAAADGLQQVVDAQVVAGRPPGAVGLVAEEDDVTVASSRVRGIGGEPMTPNTIFRYASITEPILAAATIVLVECGRVALDDPVARRLPELAEPITGSTDRWTTWSPPSGRSPCATC